MKMLGFIWALAFTVGIPVELAAQKLTDYKAYHQEIIRAEELIAHQQYPEALALLEHTIDAYDYAFLRDYKVAAQLALYLADKGRALSLLRGSVAAGWTLKKMQKSRWLTPLRSAKSDWRRFQAQYVPLRTAYEKHLNHPLRAAVQAMARQDQQLALTHLLMPGKRAKERFLRRKFIPHSERQLARLEKILLEQGYPGEKLIGNGNWMMRILSHHNSISVPYTQQDTLYQHLQPYLLQAIWRGELSPAEYAVVEDWYVAIASAQRAEAYGYLNPLTEQELPQANARRQRIGLRSVELRNQLVTVQEQTGMNLFLDGVFWVKGKIQVVAKR